VVGPKLFTPLNNFARRNCRKRHLTGLIFKIREGAVATWRVHHTMRPSLHGADAPAPAKIQNVYFAFAQYAFRALVDPRLFAAGANLFLWLCRHWPHVCDFYLRQYLPVIHLTTFFHSPGFWASNRIVFLNRSYSIVLSHLMGNMRVSPAARIVDGLPVRVFSYTPLPGCATTRFLRSVYGTGFRRFFLQFRSFLQRCRPGRQ